jgi:hypothetical protein
MIMHTVMIMLIIVQMNKRLMYCDYRPQHCGLQATLLIILGLRTLALWTTGHIVVNLIRLGLRAPTLWTVGHIVNLIILGLQATLLLT